MNSGCVDAPDIIQLYRTHCYSKAEEYSMSQNVSQNHSLHTNIQKFSADHFSYNLFHKYSKKFISVKKIKGAARLLES